MERSPMLNFLSRDSILSHLSYLKDLRLKYSVFQKSVEAMIGSEGFRFSKIRNGRSFASEGDRILVEIELHDVYFDSFSDEMIRSEIIKKSYGSVDSFLYETYLFVKDKREGFLCFFKDRHGNIRLDFFDADLCRGRKKTPILVIDLYEHAYFADYGFSRNEYLKNALSHINLAKLEESIDN